MSVFAVGSLAINNAFGSSPHVPALDRPEALAVKKGSLFIVNAGTNQVLLRGVRVGLTTFAGTGRAGYSGDGGPAIHAALNEPTGITIGRDGTLYIADTGNNRVRAVAPGGTMRTVAGNGRGAGTFVSGLPAARATIPSPVAVAVDRQGLLYIADQAGIQRLAADKTLDNVIRGGPSAIRVDGRKTALWPSAIAVDRRGRIYVADESPKLLIEFSPDGRHILRSWKTYVSQGGLTQTPTGDVIVADYGAFAVDRVVRDHLQRIKHFSLNSIVGLPGTFRPSGVAETSDGTVYTDTDGANGGTNSAALLEVSATGHIRLLSR